MARITRRQFVEQAALVGAGLGVGGLSLLGAGCRRTLPASPDGATAGDSPLVTVPPDLRTLTAAQFITIAAFCERLLPRDEDPGAIDLGVPVYIDRMITNDSLAAAREVIVRVMPALDRQSKKRFGGKAFHEAASDEQDALLTAWQRGASGERRFFETVFALTLEGAFGDPKYGGNTGGRGFGLIGFTPGPPMQKNPGAPHAHEKP